MTRIKPLNSQYIIKYISLKNVVKPFIFFGATSEPQFIVEPKFSSAFSNDRECLGLNDFDVTLNKRSTHWTIFNGLMTIDATA